MIQTKTAATLALLLVINSAHADDGLTPGPGLFSGSSGEFSLTSLWRERGESTQSVLDEHYPPAITRIQSNYNLKDEGASFAAYKEWKMLQSQNPDLYENFELWLEYKSYLQDRSEP